jgi:hypothetical protein
VAAGLGSAKPIASDATAGSDLDAAAASWTMDRRGCDVRSHVVSESVGGGLVRPGASVSDLRALPVGRITFWLVGLRGLEPRASSLSGCRYRTHSGALVFVTWATSEPDPTDSPLFPPIATRALGLL